MICLTPKQAKASLSTVYKAKKIFTEKNSFLRKRGSGGLNKNRKVSFLIALATVIKRVSEHGNELKGHEKTARIIIKQHLIPDLNPLNYAI